MRSLVVRQEHFSAPNFSAFISFWLQARPRQVLSALCVSIFSLSRLPARLHVGIIGRSLFLCGSGPVKLTP
jgi:hypothetical protein